MTMSDNLQSISDSLYSDKPNSRLFHYTSIDGLMGIVEKRALWASEVRYLNDAHELHHFGSLIDQQIVPGQVLKSDSEDRQILGQFRKWLKERLSFGPLIFVSSLTEKGNLLSQWRGYCPHGQGVSLGFNPDLLNTAATDSGFTLGRCIYDRVQQVRVVEKIIKSILAKSKTLGPESQTLRHPTQSYYSVFDELEGYILSIAALLKHPAFSEEREWRAVSRIFSNYVSEPIRYRATKSMLVPYIDLPLPSLVGRIVIPEIVVGPTPTPDLSINSISQFISKNASGQCCVAACGIPYRP